MHTVADKEFLLVLFSHNETDLKLSHCMSDVFQLWAKKYKLGYLKQAVLMWAKVTVNCFASEVHQISKGKQQFQYMAPWIWCLCSNNETNVKARALIITQVFRIIQVTLKSILLVTYLQSHISTGWVVQKMNVIYGNWSVNAAKRKDSTLVLKLNSLKL